MDRAAALAGRGEAVDPGNLLLRLAGDDGLDGLAVVRVRVARRGKIGDCGRVRAGERAVGETLDLFDHLGKAVISAGLQDRSGHGDGPDARREQLVAVEGVRAARERDAHLALERAGDAIAHLDGQREEAPAGHIHFVVRQFSARRVDREGVRKLEAELETLGVCQRLKPVEHRDGVLPLEILVEVVLIKDDVVIAHRVENCAGGFVAEDGRVAFDERVQTLFGQEIGRDALDLLRRTAVQRGDRDAPGDARRDVRDELFFLREQLGQHFETLFELRRIFRMHHVVDVAVDLHTLDALEVVADGHVEHEAVGIAEAIDLGENLQRAPRLDILVLRLPNLQLGRPLLIVAFVRGQNAGTRHAAGQLFAVHLLDGLDLEEARTGHVGRDDVLCQLAVRAGGRSERRLDALTEDGERLARGVIRHVNAEDLALAGVFCDDPVHQRPERDRIHSFRHEISSFTCVVVC